MTGAAGCGGDGRRQEGDAPDRGSVGAGGVTPRHLGSMTVNIRALTVTVIESRWRPTAKNQ